MTRDLHADARLLGGEASGTGILCPGPNHSKSDRSLSLRRSVKSPLGYFFHSFSGDSFEDCSDLIRLKLGLSEFEPGAYKPPIKKDPESESNEPSANSDYAKRIWEEAKPIKGSLAEKYLFQQRGLRLDSDRDWSDTLRFHPKLRLEGKNTPGMVALMRDIETSRPRAIQRTFLSKDGLKITRRMLGPAKGRAVMLDRLDGTSLAIGEGLESTLSGRVFGYCPAWAVGSAGAIAAFPVLPEIEHLFIFAENDRSGANENAIFECRERWAAAGKRVTAVRPSRGDLNDELLALPFLPPQERGMTFLEVCTRFWPGAEIVAEPDQEKELSWVPLSNPPVPNPGLCHAERILGTIKRIGG